jgi:hypothetical protein
MKPALRFGEFLPFAIVVQDTWLPKRFIIVAPTSNLWIVLSHLVWLRLHINLLKVFEVNVTIFVWYHWSQIKPWDLADLYLSRKPLGSEALKTTSILDSVLKGDVIDLLCDFKHIFLLPLWFSKELALEASSLLDLSVNLLALKLYLCFICW